MRSGIICGHTSWATGKELMCAADEDHAEGEHWYCEVIVMGEDDA